MKHLKAVKSSKVGQWSLLLKQRCQTADVSDSSIVLAYYILLSICPLLIIMGSLLNIIGISYAHLSNTLALILPNTISHYLKPGIYSSLNDGSTAQLSIGLLIMLWSSSRMIAAFQRTVNLAYGLHRPGAIINHLLSFIWMLLFLLMIVGIMFFSIFGQMLIRFLLRYFNGAAVIWHWLDRLQLPAALVFLYGIVCALYYFVPLLKVRFKFIWQGALIATVGMLLLSRLFSFYLKYFSRSLSAYHALGTFIILMFWLYFFGLLLLFGAVVNATNQEYGNKALNVKRFPRTHFLKKIVKKSHH